MDSDLHDFLLEKAHKYNNSDFIESDPIQIPHLFSKKQDIEISGFLSAIIAWGNRKMIINSAKKIINYLDNSPHDFIKNHTEKDLENISGSIHRTFNSDDFKYFLKALQNIYIKYESLEDIFIIDNQQDNINYKENINQFRDIFLSYSPLQRTYKHLGNPYSNSACKRINMFLRWMVRSDSKKVDFGIWQKLDKSKLSIPLDVHVGNVSRSLGLLERKQSDWKSVELLDLEIRKISPKDPLLLDFAFMGIGTNEK